jgi:hypothetical protein
VSSSSWQTKHPARSKVEPYMVFFPVVGFGAGNRCEWRMYGG